LLGAGTPEMLAKNANSHTGTWLARILKGSGNGNG
jgi:hypothetical protein